MNQVEPCGNLECVGKSPKGKTSQKCTLKHVCSICYQHFKTRNFLQGHKFKDHKEKTVKIAIKTEVSVEVKVELKTESTSADLNRPS